MQCCEGAASRMRFLLCLPCAPQPSALVAVAPAPRPSGQRAGTRGGGQSEIHPGSMPLALNTVAAAGPDMNLSNACAAAGSLAFAETPAA